MRFAASLSTALLLIAGAARAEPPPTTLPAAPYVAVVRDGAFNIHLRPDAKSPTVGLLRGGAFVAVTGCVPDCAAPEAWALLDGAGAIEASALRPPTPADAAAVPLRAEELWYGRIDPKARRIYSEPKLAARVLDHQRIPQEVALRPDAALQSTGWLARVEGGFVRVPQVARLTVSAFAGEAKPTLPLVFVRRSLSKAENKRRGTASDPRPVARYDRLPLRGKDGVRFVTDRGTLPPGAVRVIAPHERPAGIPAGARWVVVDLSEQTLTAYEDSVPVYATLISSGKSATKTLVGLYRVDQKMIYSDMHGEKDDPYTVDRVPYVLYFNKNDALHGTYWHDHFGDPASHGCVNLSIADAKWLFDWAPPALPIHWDTIQPLEAGLETLWVLIER